MYSTRRQKRYYPEWCCAAFVFSQSIRPEGRPAMLTHNKQNPMKISPPMLDLGRKGLKRELECLTDSNDENGIEMLYRSPRPVVVGLDPHLKKAVFSAAWNPMMEAIRLGTLGGHNE
ncbi:unnamed protein product [Protopolystoma xenopodis]|uniref:Uncharacterized protein n=1 Tax=Protopolystoma xenopodis TaxID=117903 RepID=A0A3S5FFW5_9PLAT|nr:unnamed protein product [Protopolystoma xenopodis]